MSKRGGVRAVHGFTRSPAQQAQIARQKAQHMPRVVPPKVPSAGSWWLCPPGAFYDAAHDRAKALEQQTGRVIYYRKHEDER